MRGRIKQLIIEIIAVLVSGIVFWIPFYYILINSFKNTTEASWMQIGWPGSFHIIENYKTVLASQEWMVPRAFLNSAILTVMSIALLILVSSMAGFVLQRRKSKCSGVLDFFLLAGLIVPPSIVPTYWMLNFLHVARTFWGLSLVEVALSLSFSTILYKAFFGTISREIDEAAIIDGCGRFRMFFQILLPLVKPVTSTIVVLSSISIYNDFVNPLYFLPGAENATVQLSVYYFFSQYVSDWNLVFADVVLISIPMLILFLFFNKRIVAGMTAGAIKG
jgi:raffinose/stachyose/melibiose transport system permease protein